MVQNELYTFSRVNVQLERPPEHEIDSAGERLLRDVFEPIGWAVNKIEHDYGVDFDVQIFKDHKATGEWFKVQLKSSQVTRYSGDGSFVSQRLDLGHAKHYSCEIRDPLVVIHADVKNRKTFWYAPQLDGELKRIVSGPNPPSNLTVRIPKENELPRSLTGFLTALEQVQIILGAARVIDAPVADFAQAITGQGEQEKCIHEFQDKIDGLRLEKAHMLFRAGSLQEARERVNQILQNSDSSIESRFSAILEDELISLREYFQSDIPQSELGQIHLRTSLRLRSLTRKGNPALKFFSLIALKAAELEILTFRDFGLLLNWKGHAASGNPLMAIGFYIERVESARLVTEKYNQCLRLARNAAKSPHLWALPRALLRIVEGLATFFILRGEDHPGILDAYFTSAMRLCRLAADTAAWNGDDDVLSHAATTAMLLFKGQPDEVQNFVNEILGKIQGAEQKRLTQEALERVARRRRGEDVEGDIPATTAQVIQNRATALGIDLLNDTNPAAKLVRLGIKDADPGRVLAHCQHAFVSIGLPTDTLVVALSGLLQLPSIGAKVLHCDLHNYAVEGPSLDSICESFKSQYCNTCPDRSSRPPEWKYSDEWQQQENLRHGDFMAKFWMEKTPRHGS
jgi:hypothetical protein